MNKKEVYVFLDFAIESENVGRVVIKLDYSVVPKSVENFRCLCTGEKGFGKLGKPLHYKNTVVHKAIPEYMIQCGDITNGNGTGGESIYGPFFEDENFTLQHDVAGIIGMANIGKKNTNSSQFYITVVPCLHLNEKNVAIGRVVKGLDVVREISETETVKDVPVKKCEITNCGQLEKDSDWGLCELDGTADVYPPFPQDWDAQLNEITIVIYLDYVRDRLLKCKRFKR